MFDSSIEGAQHFADRSSCQPFSVGWIEAGKGFVHVLDDASLEILLGNRDTITDFVEYLRWKEELIGAAKTRCCVVKYCGEEDLLAEYLLTGSGGNHGFQLPDNIDMFFLPEGGWENFLESPQRAAQLNADEVSYAFDRMIETFNRNILAGSSYDIPEIESGIKRPIADRERIMRFFARETRLRRRLLAEALVGLVEKTPPTQRATRVVHPPSPGDPYYCFLVYPNPYGRPDEEYRRVRANLLFALCYVTKLLAPDALDIIGFATENDILAPRRSEDAPYLNARAWSPEMDEYARELQVKHSLLINVTEHKSRMFEFPIQVETDVKPGRNPRNKPCPCGSGKKYKKCHGK